MSPEKQDAGRRVTVMGLGLHGGGLASARFFATRGASVTVTDLRDETTLAESLRKLADLEIRYVLGRHEMGDFRETDLVVKNPGVRSVSPYLAAAREAGVAVETDLSVFLRSVDNPVIAVTGTKGKSTVASAIHHGLSRRGVSRLGGNITVSPLTFITPPETLGEGCPVVLELSSWQLGDLRGKGVLDPVVAAVTTIFADHMDAYAGDMEAYVRDKRVIVEGQSPEHTAVLSRDEPRHLEFAAATHARKRWYTAAGADADASLAGGRGLLLDAGERVTILDGSERVRGVHNQVNLLTAALALQTWGMETGSIRDALVTFGGVEHRLELFLEHAGVRYWNDSAATVPEAALAAGRAMDGVFHLICGGNDKKLDFTPFRALAKLARGAYVLAGTAAPGVTEALRAGGLEPRGPYESLREAVASAMEAASPGESVLFSPGCTSFGMFLNEFDRGRKLKETVRSLAPS